MADFTHIDEKGRVRMVDVSGKEVTQRTARAQAVVAMMPETFERIRDQAVKKGNVLETARIAGVMGAKQTAQLIPMCHPLQLNHVQVDFFPDPDQHTIRIEALARVTARASIRMVC